ncbi:MAG: hypothetical protein AAF481_06960 [Acidobacteriota bacterium]
MPIRPPTTRASRYERRPGGEGNEDQHHLRCREAPNLEVVIDREFSFSEAEARKLGERVILLDGAGAFAPLRDTAKHLYNLDHHEGCVRAFTLATCEQALIMVVQGLELGRGSWRILANEPDLDTVFAIWVLLNHRRLLEMDTERLDEFLPLLRLEGAIDANGYKLAQYCGLPTDLLARTRRRLDALQEAEKSLKASGEWTQMDPLDYTTRMLDTLDRQTLPPADLEVPTEVEKDYGHFDIGGDRVAVVVRDEAGIYEVEERLRAAWGDRLGIVVLEKEPGHYTLRLTAALAGIDLGAAYQSLNLEDPAVDGRPRSKRWGGSDDIGGSPRPSGSALTPAQIGSLLERIYTRRGSSVGLRGVALAAFSLPLAVGAFVAGREIPWPGPWRSAWGLFATAVAIGLLATFGSRWASRRRLWLFGFRRPAFDGISITLTLGGALLAAGFAWRAIPLAGTNPPEATEIAALAVAAVALESLWRGYAHGLLRNSFLATGKQSSQLNPAILGSAALTGATAFIAATTGWLEAMPAPVPVWDPWLVTVLATGGALLLGLLRERTLSLWPGALAVAAGWIARRVIEIL